jgi:hypothetical protein
VIGRAGLLLFLAVFLSAAFLHHPRTGWNVNSRLALVFAVVDQGSFAIDAYHLGRETGTMDKAIHEGHVYSDKLIGVSLLAVPVYAGMRLVGSLFGVTPEFQQANYLLRVLAVSAPAGLAALLLWRLLVHLGADERRGLLATLTAFFGSLLFGYATVFYPYLPGIAAALGALWLTLAPPGGSLGRGASLAVGALCGLALLCDFMFGLLVAGICALFTVRTGVEGGWLPARVMGGEVARSTSPRGSAGNLGWAALAGCLVLSIFLAYSLSIFGRPAIPYEFHAKEAYRLGMQQGLMGATLPRPAALWFLTVHPYRGLFFWSPLWIAALVGCGLALRSPGRRRLVGALGLYGFAAYLLFNASYYMWWGGWAMGPRHMLPALAVLPLGLAELSRPETPRWLWRSVLGAGWVSIALCMPLALLDPQIPQGYSDEFLWSVGVGTPLRAPQLSSLERFYGLAWLRHPGGGLAVGRLVSYLAAIAAPALATILALRLLRDRPSPGAGEAGA